MSLADVTVVVPSFNQGAFLDEALRSIFEQDVNAEVFVMDGGSTDNSVDIIHKWEHLLAGWRSAKDNGQAAAINEGVALGSAPFVAWLNSDDFYLPGGLHKLVEALSACPNAAFAYGRTNNMSQKTGVTQPTWVERFSARRLAIRCIISQPGTLILREAWRSVSGLNPSLQMAMDYDLWWRLYKQEGPPAFVDDLVAVNRVHPQTKTNTRRFDHYKEAIHVVKTHYGSVPIKWWLAQPYSVWFKSIFP